MRRARLKVDVEVGNDAKKHLKGALAVGENAADIGGVAIAYDAFKMTKEGQDTTKVGGYTPAVLYF